MTQLTNTDYVQLPPDSAGKKTGFLLATVSGGAQVYLPAGLVTDAAGTAVDVSTQQGSTVALNANDKRTHRLLGEMLLEQIRTNQLLTELLEA